MAYLPILKQLQTLFNREHRRLFVTALAITRSRACAEDAVHDALLAVADVKHAPDDLRAYLFRVVRNKALHRYKHRQTQNDNEDSETLLDGNSNSLDADVLAMQVNRHIGRLDNNYQEVLILKLFADLTFDDIAKLTDNSPNTVASWYRRGLAQLKELIHAPAQNARAN